MAKEPRDISKSWIVIIGLPIFLTVLGALISPLGQQVSNALFGQTGTANKGTATEGTLHIDAITYEGLANLNVLLRNTDDTDAVISKLTIRVMTETELFLSGEIAASQGFEMPLGDMPVGQEKSIQVNHGVTAKQADQIQMYLGTSRQVKIRLTITYNGTQTASGETWLFPEYAPEESPP